MNSRIGVIQFRTTSQSGRRRGKTETARYSFPLRDFYCYYLLSILGFFIQQDCATWSTAFIKKQPGCCQHGCKRFPGDFLYVWLVLFYYDVTFWVQCMYWIFSSFEYFIHLKSAFFLFKNNIWHFYTFINWTGMPLCVYLFTWLSWIYRNCREILIIQIFLHLWFCSVVKFTKQRWVSIYFALFTM